MGEQTSAKQGVQSTARKAATTRYGTEPTPRAKPVPGAFAQENRKRPGARPRRKRRPGPA